MTQLTRGILENLLKSLEPKDNFILNIHDLLSTLRLLRQHGFTARRERGKRDDGTQWKLSRFRVLDRGVWCATLLVDTSGFYTEGGMMHFKTPPMLLEAKVPPLKLDNDYSLDSILMHTHFGMGRYK